MPFNVNDRIVTRANLATYNEARAAALEAIRHLLVMATITRMDPGGLSGYAHFDGTDEGDEVFFSVEEIDHAPDI